MSKCCAVWAERVKQLRLERKWSQATLAKVSGLSLVTVRTIESGGNTTTDSLHTVADALNVKLQSLLCTPGDLPILTGTQLDLLVDLYLDALIRRRPEVRAFLRVIIRQTNDLLLRTVASTRSCRNGLKPELSKRHERNERPE